MIVQNSLLVANCEWCSIVFSSITVTSPLASLRGFFGDLHNRRSKQRPYWLKNCMLFSPDEGVGEGVTAQLLTKLPVTAP
jgi:hypothetical protein